MYRLHVSLFVYDNQHNTLPKSFKHYMSEKNLEENNNLLNTDRPRTHFSSKLPKHNFIKTYGIVFIIRYKRPNPENYFLFFTNVLCCLKKTVIG